MDRILFGDNQFFAVNHLSDEKARAQSIQFRKNEAIIKVLDTAIELGIKTFMCTTHDRIAHICDHIRANSEKYKDFKIFPCMPYAHKYANAVTELGILGALREYLPGNIFSTMAKGGLAYARKDYIAMMELLIDAEMKMFKGIDTPVIFIQNVLTDLILGLGMKDIFKAYHEYIIKKFNAEPGYITMNLPLLLNVLEEVGIKNPIICSSINKIGFRMAGGTDIYEKTIRERKFRPIAMQVLAAGALPPEQAFEYACKQKNIESILFGSSSREHIKSSIDIIKKYSQNSSS
ncbi:MAG: hypothetical protein JXB49_01315 [Bacteroidales bacterium]|nr:hypothetical protein [Bacteroidales bacterium]